MHQKATKIKPINEVQKKIDKMRFYIISNFKSQHSRNNLLLFTLDN